MGKVYGMLHAMDVFEATGGKGHDHCPKCGAVNGPLERLGSGTCNACLDKEVKRLKAKYQRRGR